MLLSTLIEKGLATAGLEFEFPVMVGEVGPNGVDITGGNYSPEPATTVSGSAGSAPSGGGDRETPPGREEPSRHPRYEREPGRQNHGDEGSDQPWYDDPKFEEKTQKDNLFWRVADAVGTFFGGPIITIADMATSAGESAYRGGKTIKEVVEQDKGGMGSLSGSGPDEGNPGTDWKAALDHENRTGPGQW